MHGLNTEVLNERCGVSSSGASGLRSRTDKKIHQCLSCGYAVEGILQRCSRGKRLRFLACRTDRARRLLLGASLLSAQCMRTFPSFLPYMLTCCFAGEAETAAECLDHPGDLHFYMRAHHP